MTLDEPIVEVPEQARYALDQALELAAAGYQLTPVFIRRREDGKKGAQFAHNWRHEAAWSSDRDQIRAWWSDDQDTSFALRTGTEAGVDVVDLDVKDGADAVAWWSQQGHPLGSVVVETPSGGWHLYYRACGLPTKAGLFAPGVDTRGDGGLVFAPGAHVVGEAGSYRVQGDLVPLDALTDLDPTVAHAIRSAVPHVKEYAADGAVVVKDRAWAIEKTREQVDRLAALPAGTGGSLFRDVQMGAAMMMGRLVEAGATDLDWAVEKLEQATLAVWGSISAADAANIASGLADGPRKERWQFRVDPADGTSERAEDAVGDEASRREHVRAGKVAERLDALEVNAEAQRLFAARHRTQAPTPEPVLLPDLLALPVDPVPYRIDGLLRAGERLLLAAPHKAGKSTLVGNMIRCLVDGGPLLGRHETHPIPGRVVLLDTELPVPILQDWLGKQGIQNVDQVAVVPLRDRLSSFDLSGPEGLVQWTELLAPLEPGFVILDCLRPVLDAMGLDEKTEAGRFLAMFSELLGRLAVPECAVVQHMGHAGERARGDSALLGWPGANWKLVRQDPDDDASPRYFSAYGRDVEVGESLLTLDRATNRLTLVGGSRRDSVARDAVPALLDLLGRRPGLSGAAIEAALAEQGTPNKVARSAIKLAIRDSRVAVTTGARGAHLHSLAPQLGSSSQLVTARQTGSNDLGSSSYRAAEDEVDGTSPSSAEPTVCDRCRHPADRLIHGRCPSCAYPNSDEEPT